MGLEVAKCPSCGASIQVPTDTERTFCAYCGSQILSKAAIGFAKVELSGSIQLTDNTAEALLSRAAIFVKLDDFSQAFTILEEASNKHPGNWEIWWGKIYCISKGLNPTYDERQHTNRWFRNVEKTAPSNRIPTLMHKYDLYCACISLIIKKQELKNSRQELRRLKEKTFSDQIERKYYIGNAKRAYAKSIRLMTTPLTGLLLSILVIVSNTPPILKLLAGIVAFFTIIILFGNNARTFMLFKRVKSSFKETLSLDAKATENEKQGIYATIETTSILKAEISSIETIISDIENELDNIILVPKLTDSSHFHS